jgi:glycosyltransferase involved in cell wall biosynthesis
MNANADTKPRILMVGPRRPPVGGMATVVENLVDALSPDYEVRLVNNVKTTSAGRSLAQGVTSQLRLLWQLGCGCRAFRPTLVHIHTCSWSTFWRNGADVMLARALGQRVVLHVHGAEFHRFLDSLPPGRARLARLIFSLCHRIVVLGTGWKRILGSWAEPSKVAVVPNGVPVPEAFERADDALFTVICPANYERRKGQEYLIRAVAALGGRESMRLLLLGCESEAGRKGQLLAEAQALRIADRVEIPGLATGAEMEARWRSADAFCLPSFDEGLPMSMLEAMAHRLPVLATTVGAIPEAVADGVEALLFEPGDVETLTEHLRCLVSDPERARALAEAGHARLLRDFSLSRSVALLREVYEDVVRAERGRPSRPSVRSP